MAQKLERHELVEFRRIAAILYKMNGRAADSIELSKQDRLWKDAMSTAAECGNSEVVEDLLRFFVNTPEIPQSVFGACLYTCYNLIRPDVALELAWRNGLQEFVVPYMIQSFRDLTDRVSTLEERLDKKDLADQAAQDAEKAEEAARIDQMARGGMLALTNAPQYPQYQQQQFQPQQQGFG